MARTSLMIQENDLRDGRGARSAMRGYKIFRVEKLECRAVARDLVCCRDQIMRRKSESRSVQHLADVASRLRSLGVMVEKCDARYNIKKHHAAKDGDRLARELRGEDPEW